MCAILKNLCDLIRFNKLKTLLVVIVALVVSDFIYLAILWPDWDRLAKGRIPESRYITEFRASQLLLPARKRIPVRWEPRESLGLTNHMERVFLLAEDSRFYTHAGVDWDALGSALQYNWQRGKMSLGGSTITQQTVKNLFLSFSRNPLRKWHELLLTFAIEDHLNKKRILTLYLNIAEFGPGIFGIEAASRVYFHCHAKELSYEQLAQLAASLPSPRKNNPATQTKRFAKRKNKVGRIYERYLAMAGSRVKAPGSLSDTQTGASQSALVPPPPSMPMINGVKMLPGATSVTVTVPEPPPQGSNTDNGAGAKDNTLAPEEVKGLNFQHFDDSEDDSEE